MKSVIFSILVCLSSIQVYSQTVKIIEPEWEGDIIYVNDTIGKGLELERQEVSVKSKASASMFVTGMGKVTTVCSAKGLSSPVRTKNKNGTIQFIYKYKDNSTNPKTIIQVFQFTEKKNSRVVEIGSSGTFTGASSGDIMFIEFKAEKYGTQSYLITLSGLKPGEYGFSLGSDPTRTMYLFGIDE